MRPFSKLISERTQNPERCVQEVMSRLERWKHQSGNKQVTLDEVAWFGAVMCIAGVKAQEDVLNGVLHATEGGVHSIVADDSMRSSDSVG